VKRLITEELNLWRINFKSVPHALAGGQKLERIKISRKLFGQFNKLQVNDLAPVITGDERWVYFENSRPAIWVGADIRCQIRPNKLMSVKKVVFHPSRIVDIVMLPSGEALNRFFVVKIVLNSLKKKPSKFPIRIQKRVMFSIWAMPDPIWPIIQFK
jgi:hypothetical protein